jgi:SNF2 family DNA or RNA helicase
MNGMNERIIDNQSSLLGDDLKSELKSGSKVRIAASCFTLFAFNELREELAKIDELKVIFTQPTYTKNDYVADVGKREHREFFIPKFERESRLFGTDLEIRLRNKMSLKAIAKQCADWVRDKAQFRSNTTSSNMPNFIAIEQLDGRKVSYLQTPSEFSASGLGYQKSNDMMTGVFKTEMQAEYWLRQFDQIFGDKDKTDDVTEQVIESISTAYKENAPEFIYFVILYNIFTEFLDDLSEDNMPNEATGFKDTKLWSMLYDFQKDGVISIINKLEKHNGCILADSVGLGKTFTALAVILYYSLRNKSVLVLAPKRLGDNWTQYSGSANDTTNIFYQDRIRYEVLYHTDLGRGGTAHNGRNLQTVNWGNYDLVVIDESHNFRNNNPVKDRMTRYDFLVQEVIKKGVKTKVLMLSATPVNNRYNDLRNQLALAYAQDYESFEKGLDTQARVDTIFRQAQTVFNEWSRLPASNRSSKDLIDKLSIDFKILLDSVTIARSRKNIVKYYNTTKIGKFPDRLPPKSCTPELTTLDNFPTYQQIYKSIMSLSLAIYGLFDFVLPSQVAKYERQFSVDFKTSNLTLSKQNKGIKKLMTVNLLKRLESSVEAFRLTMHGLLDKNLDEIRTLDRFNDGKLYPNATATKNVFDYQYFDPDDDGGLNLTKTNKATEVKIDYADIDRIGWKTAMAKDVAILEQLLADIDRVTPEDDLKLQTLKKLIDDKLANPINPDNNKVLIFSAFADTAEYLYKHISQYVKATHGLETASITGTTNRATLKNCPKHTSHLLTMFSPISKNRNQAFAWIAQHIQDLHNPNLKWSHKVNKSEYDDSHKDIDILIATDCISEGQNLQDCDICINYDIHWNPVRIVQRYGRVDRLGSVNKCIGLINFWPPLPLNEYINLTDRVKSRMVIVDQTATADDNLLAPNDQVDDYREIQIQKLRDGHNVDIDDNNGVSISDLGLTEFRMDVVELLKIYGEPTRLPKGMHAVVLRDEERGIVPGVIFVLCNHNDSIQIKSQNLLHPYYLIYLDDKGRTVNTHLQVKQVLDAIRIASKNIRTPIDKACRKFNFETDDGSKMDKYNKLLGDAISTIITVKEESDIVSLLKGNLDGFDKNKIKGLDDFELIAFVVVK